MAPSRNILGFASSAWSREASGAWYDTHIGGHPIWPEYPPAKVAPCPRCNSPRYLVLQAYAPHPAHKHRFILIFGCNNIRCAEHNECWLAWRVCQIEAHINNSPSPPQSDALEKGTDKFLGSSSSSAKVTSTSASVIDWDATDSSDTENDDILEGLELLSIQTEIARAKLHASASSMSAENKASQPKQTCDSDLNQIETAVHQQTPSNANATETPAFPAFHVEVEEEEQITKTEHNENDSVCRLLQNYLNEEQNRKAVGGKEQWAAESDDEETPDALAYQKFQDVIARAPTQILRYSFASQPLWPTASVITSKSELKCSCGSAIVFELQLLGSCLHYLRPDNYVRSGQKEAGMSFKTVGLFTCSVDCTFRTESLVHQTSSFSVFGMKVEVVPDEW